MMKDKQKRSPNEKKEMSFGKCSRSQHLLDFSIILINLFIVIKAFEVFRFLRCA